MHIYDYIYTDFHFVNVFNFSDDMAVQQFNYQMIDNGPTS